MENLISFFINFFSKGWKESLNQYKIGKLSIDLVSLDEMVFENRNKDYGAYILRKNHNWYLATAVAFVSSVFLYVCFLPVYLGWMKEPELNRYGTWCCCMPFDELPSPPLEIFLPPKANRLQSGKPRKPRETSKVIYQIPIPAPAEGKRNDRINSITNSAEKTYPEVDPDTIKKKIKPPIWGGLTEEVIGLRNDLFDEEEIPHFMCECKNDLTLELTPDKFIIVEEEPVPINMDEVVKQVKLPNHWYFSERFIFRVLVDQKGNYVRHINLSQNHLTHSEPFEKIVQQLKFTPAIQGGKPISFWVNIPFNVKLLN